MIYMINNTHNIQNDHGTGHSCQTLIYTFKKMRRQLCIIIVNNASDKFSVLDINIEEFFGQLGHFLRLFQLYVCYLGR